MCAHGVSIQGVKTVVLAPFFLAPFSVTCLLFSNLVLHPEVMRLVRLDGDNIFSGVG